VALNNKKPLSAEKPIADRHFTLY